MNVSSDSSDECDATDTSVTTTEIVAKKEAKKSCVKAGVCSNRQEKYLQEVLLPSVDESLNDVAWHRKYTSHDIDRTERECDHLKLLRLAKAPADPADTEVSTQKAKVAAAAALTSENLKQANNAIANAEMALKRSQERALQRQGNKDTGIFQKLFSP